LAIGDNRFTRAGTDLTTLLAMHGVLVTVTRTIAANVTQRDIFSTPQNYTPTTFQATILVTGQELNELEIIAGGKPKEILSFLVTPGTILENDEIAYSVHLYKVDSAGETPIGGVNALEMCKAMREVAV